MTIDPKTLTAEERAIVDVEVCRLNALGARGLPQPEKVFHAALANVENLILARRKLYGEPQEAKRAGNVEYACQPAPPPASVASELPLAVQVALEALRYQRKSGVADGLEECVRALLAARAEKAQLPKVRAALIYVQKMLEAHRSGWPGAWPSLQSNITYEQIDAALAELDAAQAVPVGMTPELEMVAEAANAYKLSLHSRQSDDYRARLNDAIAAVRAQAGKVQAVPVEAIRYALSYLRSDTTKTNLLANIDTIDRYLAAVEGGR